MAAIISSTFLSASLLLLCLLSASRKGCVAFEQPELAAETHHHNLQVSSLLPSSVCNPSKAVDKKSPSLTVIHKHGPCSQLRPNSDAPTHAEILLHDQARVNSIHSRLARTLNNVKETAATRIPAKDGSVVGSGNYIVTVGLGTPKKDLSLIFDTGSDLTWTQCQPCARYCYRQKEPIFNPSQSKSYLNISCSSSICGSLSSATGNPPGCSSSTCVYAIQYGDSSFSVGLFGKERLTLTSTDIFDNFLFGCGENNQGLFGGAAGLLGLGRNKLSFPSQTAQKYNKVFSYCLPSSASSTGYLSFGNSDISNSVKFTPLVTLSGGASFYGVGITGISVGGKRLPISSSVFATAGTIIDSGTVITRLPTTAYSALKTAFRQGMSKYPMGKALSILDTCYDLSSYNSFSIPKISISFSGGVEVEIALAGILYVNSPSQVCLAFAGNNDDSNVGILGNVQQKTLQVVYDGANGRVGFATGGCS
ncbi:hypothetical protein SLEP1_g1806 [Rubroshorea leprosula]|uniref:Peptidase A1 domain-containing protein n=1 Tax=Rubroshorea leprosula TaxID=152421 RepID=A0AAV5HEY2_9ROSI|nr:hypothetical protein SLEP1_g1806 [Rubroshorea leprosula]